MPNLIYFNEETSLTWSSGGALDIDLGGLAADGVRVGEQADVTADAASSGWFWWELFIDGFDTAPVIPERVEAYLAGGDGTRVAGNVGTADAAGTTVSLPNLWHIGGAAVQTTTAGDNLVYFSPRPIQITTRYISPVIHNNTADALLGTADAHLFILTPVPPEIQD